MALPMNTGDRDDLASHMPINRAPEITLTGRIKRGTKGKREHGCIFCGKVYSRREHLKRHQSKHRTGAYPCTSPGCRCTFHNALLLERHRRHKWSFPFQLPEAYLFRCPSLPQSSRSTDHGLRSSSAQSSARATPATSSENGEVTGSEDDASCSPTPSYDIFAPTPQASVNYSELFSRNQYLRVPSRSSFNTRHGREHNRQMLPRSETSSPAITQNNHYNPAVNVAHGFEPPPLAYHDNPSNYMPPTGLNQASSISLLGYQAESHHPVQSSYYGAHGSISSVADSMRPLTSPEALVWLQEPRYSVPVFIGPAPSSANQSAWHDAKSPRDGASLPMYIYNRHLSDLPVSFGPESLDRRPVQQGVGQFESQGRLQGQAHTQHYPHSRGGSRLGSRTVQNNTLDSRSG